MSDDPPRPPRAGLWLLARVSSTHAAKAVVGDILEELDERRAAGDAPRWPRLWIAWHLTSALTASSRAAAPRALRSAVHTFRDAARAIRRAPSHALFILLILAIAISAATVTFSVVDAVVLRPLPFDRPEAIVQITGRDVRGATSLAPEEFWAIHDRATSFEGVASARTFATPVTIDGVTTDLPVMHATVDLFRVLSLKPLVGRVWTADEERQRDLHLAVISHSLWRERFAGDANVPGRTLRMEDTTYRIVGVLAPDGEVRGMRGWSNGVWVPRALETVGTPNGVSRNIFALARLRDGVPMEAALAEVQSVLAPLAAAQPFAYTEWQPELRQWHQALVADVRRWMMLVLGAVAMVVLIGCVNAANVMLIRSAERARELAIRASLGASRRTIALSLVAESLMLSIGASLCGLLFAVWGVGAAKAALPAGIFRSGAISLNGRVLTASAVAAIATGLLFGTVPACQASRVPVLTLLKDSGTTIAGSRRGWRSAFLVAEIACVSVLLVVSTLFVGSFIRVMGIDLGVDRSRLLAVSPREQFNVTVDEVATRLKQIPGVEDVAVATSSSLPLVGPAFGGGYGAARIRAADDRGAVPPTDVTLYRVTSNYFAVAGMRFRRGSTWSAQAAGGSEPVVLDEAVARRMFGDRDPVGLQVSGGSANAIYRVVGVVPFVRAFGPEAEAQPAAYLPIVPSATRRYAGLFVRTSPPPEELLKTVADALAPLLPPTAGPSVHLVDDAVRLMTATRRFNTTLMSLFAVLAMLIGAAGIYAVMASVVAQQTREIGVRMALGASAGQVHRRVLAQAARHLLLGLAVGLPAAWWISRGFSALLFRVRPTDLSTYIVVAVTLIFVGLVAAALPARRAAHVDPIVSLRNA